MMTRVLLVQSLSCCEHFSKCGNAKYRVTHIFSLNESLSFIPIDSFSPPQHTPYGRVCKYKYIYKPIIHSFRNLNNNRLPSGLLMLCLLHMIICIECLTLESIPSGYCNEF